MRTQVKVTSKTTTPSLVNLILFINGLMQNLRNILRIIIALSFDIRINTEYSINHHKINLMKTATRVWNFLGPPLNWVITHTQTHTHTHAPTFSPYAL